MIDELDPGTLELPLSKEGGELVGYARVSTVEQNLTLQIEALKRAGCKRIFTDVASGAKSERTGLDDALSYLRPGDTLVVWKIDRLGRSLPHLVRVVEDLRAQGIGFRSLTDSVMDTTTPGGALIFHIFAALADFERALIRERTKAGLQARKARGLKGGRKPVMTPDVLERAKAMRSKGLSMAQVAAALKVSRASIYNALRAEAATASEQSSTNGGTLGKKGEAV